MNGKDCLLDTNIVIGLFANESSITEKIKSFPGRIFIPSIVFGELFYGVLKRLVDSGYSDQDARMLIGQCLAVELFSVLKLEKPFNNDRYVSNLKKLPEEPFDD